MKSKPAKLVLALASAFVLTVSGCGGGGGGGGDSVTPLPQTPGAPMAATISGTAAAGLPLVGNVTVKDANGVSRSTPIGTNGSYSVDVTGLTAPFVFRAEGTVGGQTYVIHSAASAADANGTINITPLTDLIVANIAGQLAENYFNSGDFSSLTTSELKAEADSLKAKLLPVLLAMGVESSIDLLRTAFTPLSSALDKVLDVISVSVDPATNEATITNLVTQQQIIDSLATKAAAETSATPMLGTGMDTAADDITLIRKALSDFSAQFAAGLPSPDSLTPLMHDTTELPFRDADKNATQFRSQIATDSFLVGASFTDVVIRRIDYTRSVDTRAFVAFTVKNKAGIAINRVKNMQIAKNIDGGWRLRGDGRRLDTYSHAHMVKSADSGCVRTGLEFGFTDPNTGNNGVNGVNGTNPIQYVMVKGPGLPADGLKYGRSATGGYFTIKNVANQTGRYYVMASDCNGSTTAGLTDSVIASIPDHATYTMEAFNGNDEKTTLSDGSFVLYNDRITRRPLTLTEAQAATFPVIADQTAIALSTYSGGDLAISATGINPSGAWVYLGLNSASEATSVDGDVSSDASGGITTTLNLAPMSGVVQREIRVVTNDAYWRNMMTVLTDSTMASTSP